MLMLLRTVAGVILITIGIVGILLPIIPGIPLMLAGVATMGRDHPWLRPLMARLDGWCDRRRAASAKEAVEK
jgi:uncharacterized membrane protein YbaN (DUF454 family)